MRGNWIAGLGALAMLLAVAASGMIARADDNGPTVRQVNQFAGRLFAGKAASGANACFVRRYDAAHLAKHPAQKVAGMKLLVTAELLAEDKMLNYNFHLGVSLRGSKDKFHTAGDCGHPMASVESADKMKLGCGVDCDGGGLSIEMVNADKSILVRLEQVSMWNVDKPDDERADLVGGADDRTFRLDRVKLEQCKSLMPEDDGDKPKTM